MATTKKAAAASDVYIVVYDIEGYGDPVKVCKTLDEAKKFIENLFTEGDDEHSSDEIIKSSVKVYKSQLIGKPKVEIVFE